jgi:hypothetical protein
MSEIIGRQIEFGVATEAARGTAESAADKWARKVTANVVERAAHALDETTMGRLEAGMGRRVVQKYIEGEVSGILHIDTLGWLLGNLYGVCNTSNVAGSVYDHVFTLKQDIEHVSLSLFAKDGTVQQHVYSNGMVNTLSLTVAVDDYIRYTASFLAAAATANADTPSYDTEYDFVSRDVVVKVASSEAGLSGAAALKAKGVNLNFDAGLIRDHVVGSYEPDDIYNSQLMIEGDITLNFTDETFKDYYLGDDAVYMSITITGEADIGGGNFPTITIVLNKVQWMDWNRASEAGDLTTQPLPFRAFLNQSDLEQSEITLRNLTTEYTNVPTS